MLLRFPLQWINNHVDDEKIIHRRVRVEWITLFHMNKQISVPIPTREKSDFSPVSFVTFCKIIALVCRTHKRGFIQHWNQHTQCEFVFDAVTHMTALWCHFSMLQTGWGNIGYKQLGKKCFLFFCFFKCLRADVSWFLTGSVALSVRRGQQPDLKSLQSGGERFTQKHFLLYWNAHNGQGPY